MEDRSLIIQETKECNILFCDLRIISTNYSKDKASELFGGCVELARIISRVPIIQFRAKSKKEKTKRTLMAERRNRRIKEQISRISNAMIIEITC